MLYVAIWGSTMGGTMVSVKDETWSDGDEVRRAVPACSSKTQ